MKKKSNEKRYGTLYWITGLSGSGKTKISKKIKTQISKKYGPTIIISGDDLRNIFNLKTYSIQERLKISKKYCKLVKFITSQKINVIFATVAMFHEIREWNRKNIKNYVEIYIKSDIKKLIFQKKKTFYKNTSKYIVGMDIKAELPKKPDIVIKNDFTRNLDYLSSMLMKKINKLKQ
tara:strand:+ start:95 stop:625 length:531 start_codon:yes stop_codon:yes gene_type:complete